jgi:all-trans-retinol 13,14-reductase
MLKWADMGEVYDRIVVGDQHFDFVKGLIISKQMTYFPEEEQAIKSYVDLVLNPSKQARTIT